MEELSGGELQRFAIATAAGKEADVYMFDEPSSFLDVRQRLEAARLIRELSNDNKWVVNFQIVYTAWMYDFNDSREWQETNFRLMQIF